MSKTADVVVVGAGIVGCACAYFLARDGRQVVMLERAGVASGAAASSGGWIILQDKESPETVRVAAESRRLYDALSDDAGLAVERTGGLILAEDAGDRDALLRQQQIALAGGVRSQWVDAAVLRGLEPSLAPDLVGALHATDEAVVDPPQVCAALVSRIRDLGGEMREQTPVTGIQVRGGAVHAVVTPVGVLHTPVVVCAAGAWSGEIGAMVEVPVHVRPRRGHLGFLPEPLVSHPMLEAGYLARPGTQAGDGEGIAIRFVAQPRHDGIVIGSSREFHGYDQAPDAAVVAQMWTRAARFIPALASREPPRVSVGLRPYAAGGRPLIGRAGPEGFILATGHEGQGITLAPVTGRMVADLVAGRIARTGFELQ